MSDQIIRDEARSLAAGWWLFAIAGVLGIVVGILIIAKPGNSLATLAVIAGIFVLVDGLVELAASLSRHTANRGLAAVVGVLSVVVGIVLIRHPVGSVAVIGLLIGIWLVAIGVVRFVTAFDDTGSRVAHFLVAAVEVIAGVVIVSDPHIGFTALALIIGIALVANGVSTLALGFVLRRVERHPELLAG